MHAAEGQWSRMATKNPPMNAEVDLKLAPVVAAFAKDRQVTYGGKGFGSTALKCDGKIFAMLSSKGEFVVKLAKDRVDELVRLGKGQYFDSGRGKVMKEWLAVSSERTTWIELAKEALRFAKAARER
jgi:hypothetical protein